MLHLPAPSIQSAAPLGRAALILLLAEAGKSGHLVGMLLSFGVLGLFLVSIVDSSFVPLPVPGVTDIMIIVMAAQHANPVYLILASTLGSALGGYLSFEVGQHGGLAFLEKHVPARIFKRVTRWMESHAILSVALPAILPPPMPLAPFVLAAGALKMTVRKFMLAFTSSRAIRHGIAVWIGIRFGAGVLHLWNKFMGKYAVPILSTLWAVILISVGFAFWKIWKTSHEIKSSSGAGASKEPDPARA